MFDVWDRYQQPFVISEAHIAGKREAQMRWLDEIWRSALEIKQQGVDVRAVTAWSLLGSFDWNSLCTIDAGFYESGVFDLRGPELRPTSLVSMIRDYASIGKTTHPVLERKGYWHEPERVLFAPPNEPLPRASRLSGQPRPILITGASGTLGYAFARICEKRGLDYKLVSRNEMDIASIESVRTCMKNLKPWAVINAAGYVRVDDAEQDIERCLRENTTGPKTLALVSSELKIPLLTFSSDLVFDGCRGAPYLESNDMAPINVYGKTKAEAERLVLEINNRALVIRTSSFFGPWDRHNFLSRAVETLVRGEILEAAADLTISPTYIPDLVNASLDLMIDGLSGRVHLTNHGALTWAEWAVKIVRQMKLSENRVIARPSAHLPFRAPRPRYTALTSERLRLMPDFDDAFERFFRDKKFQERSL
jgi:dTDP-4-dehydrorhamnose reductase